MRREISISPKSSKMKAAFLIVLIGFAAAVPQPRKDFHEHFDDFMGLIRDEAGDELEQLMSTYQQFDEFNAALDYVKTSNFKEIVLEMESLPEFQAVVDFLEAHNIDITFFLDLIDEVLADTSSSSRATARQASGTSLTSFIQDSVALFPQQKLDDLFTQKKNEDEAFRDAIDSLFSEEWDAVFTALLVTPQFQKEVETLHNNGVNFDAFIGEMIAVFGQNK